jgi:hypothetical protein
MVIATPSESPFGDNRPGLAIHGQNNADKASVSPAVWVGLTKTGLLRLTDGKALAKPPATFPGDLEPPVIVSTFRAAVGQETPSPQTKLEFDPARLLTHLRPVLSPQPDDDNNFNKVCEELTNSTQNGRYWIEWYEQHRKPLSSKSSIIEWEQALYTGHPLHPVSYSLLGNTAHRT